MKSLFLILVFIVGSFVANAQTKTEKDLVNFLNKDLRWEVKNQFKNSDRIERYDTLVVAEPFQIKNGILSIAVKRKKTLFSENANQYTVISYTEKQEIDLRNVIKLTKDINVIFVTERDAVKIYEDGKETRTYDLFFLQLCCSERYNEAWASEFVALLKKAGYSIEMDNWYD